jgi:KDO2-lipid IV(A) lauroyltransferase
MDARTLARRLQTLRFDGAFWRRFAELGCVYGPEWWKRGSPPVIAAIVYAVARQNREAVRRNQRQVRGPRGPWRERWDAYRVFGEFARTLTETLEQWGPRPKPLDVTVVPPAQPGRAVVGGKEIALAALAEKRGLVIPTAHYGSWEVAARGLADFGRPVNLVMAQEPNPTVRHFVHRLRTRHGVNVIYSDRSVFAALPILQALRRNEVVGMQLDPWGPLRGTQTIDFCGRAARFQLGPFVVARLARAPVMPVFCVRTGMRQYELRVVGRFDPTTPAEAQAAFVSTVRAYEALVRERPSQWLVFEDVWRDADDAAAPYEMVPQASGFRRR